MGTTDDGHLLVVSQRAGSTDVDEVDAAVEVLGAELAQCTKPEDLDGALDRLDGRTLVIAGGDGSLHLAVTKLYLRGTLGSTRIGLVPLGTGNDLARALEIPLDPATAAVLVRDGEGRATDLVLDDAGGVVVNAAHVGIGADAAEHAGALKPTLMVGIGNGRGIGGGTSLLPHALVDDGLLDVMVSKATGPFARIRFGAALASGDHLSDPQVRFARGRSVTVSGEPVGVNSDGETGVEVERRTWTVSPGAWTLIRP